jgi:hypothetical protein
VIRGRIIHEHYDKLENLVTSQLLSTVHKVNEIIEREAGPRSETLAVYWTLTPAEGLQVTVVNASSPQTPFAFADVTDLQMLRDEFRKWCSGGGNDSPQ